MAVELLCEDIQRNLQRIHGRIKTAMKLAARTDEAQLIAISKFQPAHAVTAAVHCGQVFFGENYVQEAIEKQAFLDSCTVRESIQWHFTGHVQSRKAKDVVDRFALIHTLDSIKLANALEKHAALKHISQAVLIQVNVGDEAQKSGILATELFALAEYVALHCPHLNLQGLMCLPPVFDAGLAARPWFARLREMRDALRAKLALPLPHLSMGMSGDLEAAILEGATLVRVGTDIFGERVRIGS